MRISPIVQTEAGYYAWSVTSLEWDNTAGDVVETTISYRTDHNGQGLWAWTRAESVWYTDGSPLMEWKQLLGHTQFDLNCAQPTRRARVAQHFKYAR